MTKWIDMKTPTGLLKRTLLLVLALCATGLWPPLVRATDWSAEAYDLYFGDFNGDTLTDMLYVAKSSGGVSGINLSDGSGPNVAHMSWASNFLGIPWSGNQLNVIVTDFNNDQKADIFLQSKVPGDHYLLLANSQGKFSGITQTIANTNGGVTWSGDVHRAVAGDFNHDGHVDIFLQPTTRAGTSYVMLASSISTFTASSPAQSWADGAFGLHWATTEARVQAGNFDGLYGADLLVQARPRFVLVNYEIPIPVPTYLPDMNGLLVSTSSGSPVFSAVRDLWSRNEFGADWSPLFANVVAGDFDSDGRIDVLLQGSSTGKSSYLLSSAASGVAFGTGTLLSSSGSLTADTYRLSSASFSGIGLGLYLQGATAATPNLYASSALGGTVTPTSTSPVLAASIVEYTYDALGRLVRVVRSGAVGDAIETEYTLTKTGNRESVESTAL
jgi:hypothetical protein